MTLARAIEVLREAAGVDPLGLSAGALRNVAAGAPNPWHRNQREEAVAVVLAEQRIAEELAQPVEER